MISYKTEDAVFSFEGSVSIEYGKEWVSPWRIPFQKENMYPNLLGETIARCPSGVRIAFTTNSKNIELEFCKITEPMRVDVMYEDKSHVTYELNSDNPVMRLPEQNGDMKKFEFWLDPRMQVFFKELRIDENALIKKTYDTRRRWVHYGSSISHSVRAHSPSQIWTAIVANELDLHLTNFGFNGNCLLEPMTAKMIRDTKADFITLKLGVNCLDGNLNTNSFPICAIGLIDTIREKQPNVPIVVISPIICTMRDREAGARCPSGYTIAEMRDDLKKVVTVLREYGDNNLYYFSGLDIYNEEHLCYLPDGLHPDGDGQQIFANQFINNILKKAPLGID